MASQSGLEFPYRSFSIAGRCSGVTVLPRSQKLTHITENGSLFGFEIDDEDMALLSGLAQLHSDTFFRRAESEEL